ncbi:Structural maintenance of chromosomes protein 4 [Sorochytrium milnesiophthora]
MHGLWLLLAVALAAALLADAAQSARRFDMKATDSGMRLYYSAAASDRSVVQRLASSAPPSSNTTQNASSIISFTLACPDIDPTACAKMNATLTTAAAVLGNILDLSAPVVIDATYNSFCGAQKSSCPAQQKNALGWAMPSSLWSLYGLEGVDPDYTYPQALAKQLVVKTLSWNDADILARFNADASFWFEGDVSPIRPDQTDALYVVVHELLHGFGLISSWNSYFASASLPLPTTQFITPQPNVQTDDHDAQQQQTGLLPLDAGAFNSPASSSASVSINGFLPNNIYDKFLFDNVHGWPLSLHKFTMSACTPSPNTPAADYLQRFLKTRAGQFSQQLYVAMTTAGGISFILPAESNQTSSSQFDQAAVYTPSSFTIGSSVSHVDPANIGAGDFLMGPVTLKGSTLLSATLKQASPALTAINPSDTHAHTFVANSLSPAGPKVLRMLHAIGFELKEPFASRLGTQRRVKRSSDDPLWNPNTTTSTQSEHCIDFASQSLSSGASSLAVAAWTLLSAVAVVLIITARDMLGGSDAAPKTELSPPVASLGAMSLNDPPIKRLVITWLELTNFKSYAGTQRIGPFHKSFTSIVGPNGSGKSNVIDAMLFVFGYRASKIRQNKLSQLIHNSARFPDLPSCAVTVFFEEILDRHGSSAHDTVPGSQLTVSRMAFRNNASKYEINGKTSSYSEVTTLLRERGIDLDHKRFLILQGEVESISQMKPKAANEHEEGLLEYLEDIIGTSKYKTTIETAAVQIEALNEQRAEKLNRVKIVESQRNALQEKRKEALEYLRSENELVTKKSMLWQHQLRECNQSIGQSQQDITELDQRIQEERAKHKALMEEVERLEKEYTDRHDEYQKYAQEIVKLDAELSEMKNHDVKLREQKKALKSKGDKLKKASEKEKHVITQQSTWLSNYEQDTAKQAAELKELEERLGKEEKELAKVKKSLAGKTAGVQAELDAKQLELAPWSEMIAGQKSKYDVARAEYDLLKEKSSRNTRELDQAQAKLEQMRAALEEKQSAKAELDRLENDVKTRMGKLHTRMQTHEQEDRELRELVNQARAKADEARATLMNAQSRGNVLQALLSERDKGRIPGIFNRLGSLGVIDDKYDVAISTACPQLDNIVVDAVKTGEKCLDFLRRQNVGRAHLVCLDKLQQFDTSHIQTPENVPRLFDLVKPKEARFAPAFYHALRDTLVAENLDQANRIAFGRKRWRVVTLAGQLIDTSGTMSGGGNKLSKGLMGSRFVRDDVREEDVIAMERKRDEASGKLRALSDQQQTIQRDLESLNAALATVPVERAKLSMDIESINRQIADAGKYIKRLSEAERVEDKDTDRLTELEQIMQLHQKELERLQQSSRSIEEDIKALQAKILDMGGIQLRTQQSKLDSVTEQINTLNEDMTRIAVQKNKAERDVAKSTTAYEKAVAELETVNADLAVVDEEIKEQTQRAYELTQKCNAEKMVLEEKKEALDGLRAELDLKLQEQNAAREVEVELQTDLEAAQNLLKAMTKKATSLKSDLELLALQPVDEDDLVGNPDETMSPMQVEQTLPQYSDSELDRFNVKSLAHSIAELEQDLKQAKPNLTVIAEYRQRHEEYLERVEELKHISESCETARAQYDDLRKQRLDQFLDGFNQISQKLKEMYQMITLGGNAELELVDTMDPFSEGIMFSVMPPKKSWKNISNLSGGEKTLSSLALVFALHHFKPTPLYVMDEIDAALDFRNVSIVANYIKDRTRDAQFVIISLRNNMFELADRLTGIYKTDNCTKSITIDPHQISLATLSKPTPAAS